MEWEWPSTASPEYVAAGDAVGAQVNAGCRLREASRSIAMLQDLSHHGNLPRLGAKLTVELPQEGHDASGDRVPATRTKRAICKEHPGAGCSWIMLALAREALLESVARALVVIPFRSIVSESIPQEHEVRSGLVRFGAFKQAVDARERQHPLVLAHHGRAFDGISEVVDLLTGRVRCH